MTAALVTGSLFRAPEQRTSKAGRPFVVTTIKAKDGDAVQWWKVLAFSDSASAELLRLGEGDVVAVQGNFKAELYRHDETGETKLSLSIIADHVRAMRQPPRERAKKEPLETNPPDNRTKQQRCAGTWTPDGGPSDDIGF
jgi:single-stranded DNA-binding protein